MGKSRSQRKEAEGAIRERFAHLNASLSERSRRLFAASEAMAFGFGGIAAVARATGMSSATIRTGIHANQAIASGRVAPLPPTRSRRAGGGRKKATDKAPTLLTDLKELLESTTRGDPACRLLWTARRLRKLACALQQRGHDVKKTTVARVLTQLGSSLQGTKQGLEGAHHPDRHTPFEPINAMVRAPLQANEPAISVDTKKKEMVGS